MIRASGPGQNSRRGMAHLYHNYAYITHTLARNWRDNGDTAHNSSVHEVRNMIHGQFQNTMFRHSRASCAISYATERGAMVRSGVFAPGYRDGGESHGCPKPISGRHKHRSFHSIASRVSVNNLFFFIERRDGYRRHVDRSLHEFWERMQIYPKFAGESVAIASAFHISAKIMAEAGWKVKLKLSP